MTHCGAYLILLTTTSKHSQKPDRTLILFEALPQGVGWQERERARTAIITLASSSLRLIIASCFSGLHEITLLAFQSSAI
jgi:hypothetical protein